MIKCSAVNKGEAVAVPYRMLVMAARRTSNKNGRKIQGAVGRDSKAE